MLRIEADVAHGYLQVSGPEVKAILDSPDSVYFSVVLGLDRIRPDVLAKRTEDPLPITLIPLLRYLKEKSIPIELDESARSLLREHLDYLNAFHKAKELGAEILGGRFSFKPSASFKRTLKSFQIPAAAHITQLPFAANFSVPGSGKTTMVLAAYSVLRETRVVEKLLVIGPRAAFEPWEDEFRACFGRAPLSARISGAPSARKGLFEEASRFEIFLTTYQMFANELESFRALLGKFRTMLVVDESHHIKRGLGGIWYDAIWKVAPLATRRVLLSGTPAPNSIRDLQPQLEILWPDVLEVSRIFQSVEDLNANIDHIRDSIKPLYMRIKKSELGLPEKVVRQIPVEMGVAQKRIYDALASEVLTRLGLEEDSRIFVRELRRALVIRLIQAATNPSLLAEFSEEFGLPPLPQIEVALDSLIRQYSKYETPPKFSKAVQIAKELMENGRKLIVWTTFVSNAHAIAKLFKQSGLDALVVTGLLPRDETESEADELTRAQVLDEFRSRTSPCALVATVQSVGEAVSLHNACSDAIYLDRTFNCGIYMQSMDRIHRIGMAKDAHVTYFLLLSSGSIDDVVHSRLEKKMEIMHHVLNDDIGILSLEVSAEDPLSETSSEDLEAVRNYLVENHGEGDAESE